MSIQRHLTSHASLMAALLEHAGHLSETLGTLSGTDVSFPKCLRYVVYTFFNGNSRDSYVADIETSALFHQDCLTHRDTLPATHLDIKTPKWIKSIIASSTKKAVIMDSVQGIEEPWESWNPREDISRIMKRSIDELI